MNIINASIDPYLVLKNGNPEEIFQVLELEIDLTGRFGTAGDTAYHVILRNEKLEQGEVIEIFRILHERGVNPGTVNYNAKLPVHLAIEKRMDKARDFFMDKTPQMGGSSYPLTRFFIEDECKQFWREASRNYNNLDSWSSEMRESDSEYFMSSLLDTEYSMTNKNEDEVLLLLHLAIDCNLQHLIPALLLHIGQEELFDPEYEPPLRLFLENSGFVRRVHSKMRSRRWYSRYTMRHTLEIIQIFLEKGSTVDLSVIQLATEGREDLKVIELLLHHYRSHGGDEIVFSSILIALIKYPCSEFSDSDVELYPYILRILVAKGANVDKADASGTVPVHAAFESKNVRAILWLIDVGADLAAISKNGESLLHLLIAEKWEDDVQQTMLFHILVGKGCPVNAKNKDSLTPLHLAVKLVNQRWTRMLIESGADVNCRDEHMRTPLHYAVTADTKVVEMVELLLANGANANARDVDGTRPLFHVLSKWGIRSDVLTPISKLHNFNRKYGVIETLLRAGAQANTLHTFNDEKTLDRIIKVCFGNTDIIETLLEYGLADEDSHFGRSLFRRSYLAKSEVLLERHWLKLKAVGLPCEDTYGNYVVAHAKYFADCLREVETMKSYFIDNCGTSIYDVLHTSANKRCIYVNNDKLKELVDLVEARKTFPRLAVLILASYREAAARKSLLQSAKETWMQLTGIYLPDICIDRVLADLSNVELVDMIETDYKSKEEMQREADGSEDVRMDLS